MAGRTKSDSTRVPVDPVAEEIVMDNVQEALRRNRFCYRPLTAGARRTVAQRLDELDCDPIAVLAALALGLDPRTGSPMVQVKPMKIGVITSYTDKGQPVREEQIVNHEFEAADYQLMAFCAKELAGFVHPKLKQVEHKMEDPSAGPPTIVWLGKQPGWTKGKTTMLLEGENVDVQRGQDKPRTN